MKLPKRSHLSSVVGLNLADGHLRACEVVRGKGGLQPAKTANAPLALDLLNPDAELVGREIRNLLDGAGIRERHCVVALPPRWIMTHATTLPQLSADDAAEFLQLEAEKGFPVDPAQLQIGRSTQRADGTTHVTLFAVRREHVSHLAAVLKAAGLKPVSFSLGLPALPAATAAAGAGRVTVSLESAGVTMLVAAGGGIVSFRTCDATVENEAGASLVNGAAVARELRITLEQVPADLRPQIRSVLLTGEPALVPQLADSLRSWAASADLTLEAGRLPDHSLGAELAHAVAVAWLQTGTATLEFLPPHPSRWETLLNRYSSKRLTTVGFAVAGLAAIVLLAFGWQAFRLWSLRSQWSDMQNQVAALDAVQGRIRQYRPFYDDSARSLAILKRVTECFPDTGTVTAKTFEIHTNGTVTLSGTARDNAALLATLDGLRRAPEVQGLKIEQIRLPQFTFTFRWNGTPGS